jgi:uncharacterized protein YbaR (Trm112 family)
MSLIDPLLANILVCPADQGSLTQLEESAQLECQTCGRRFPVEDGIPVMLIDDEGTKAND